MKKLILLALAVALTFALTGCGGGTGGGGASTAPPGSVVGKASINTFNIYSSNYSLKTPKPFGGSFNVSFDNGVGNTTQLYIGLSNSAVVSGICVSAAPSGYQPLVDSTYILFQSATVANKIGSFETSSIITNYMILPTPYVGIDYSRPTYVVATLCVPDFTLPVVNFKPQYISDQKSVPIVITP